MSSFSELSAAPRSKIERAEHHITDLDRQVNEFVVSMPLRMVLRQDKKAGERSLRIKSEICVPPHFSLIIGDAIHNLRSALDVAMWGVVGDKTDKPWSVQFPFSRKAEGIQKAITNRQVRFARPQVVRLIERLKPYPGGNQVLSGLHDLDVSDKHQLIITTRRFPSFTLDQLYRIDPEMDGGVLKPPAGGYPAHRVNLITHGDLIYKYPIPGTNRAERRSAANFERETDIQPTIRVTFGEGQPFDGEDVVPQLIKLADYVGRVAGMLCQYGATGI